MSTEKNLPKDYSLSSPLAGHRRSSPRSGNFTQDDMHGVYARSFSLSLPGYNCAFLRGNISREVGVQVGALESDG